MFRFLPLLIATCLGSLLSVGGCSVEQPATAPPDDKGGAPCTMSYESVEGETGPGSHYALFRPEGWNGDLVLIAHGYVSPVDYAEPQIPEEILPWRDALLELGYGVGYSSYPENGYAVKEGIIATHQLSGLFASHFGRPGSTYVMGISIGGLIAVSLAETYPAQYAGVLSLAGVVGGSARLFDYIYGMRVLFDYYYPGVLPGNALFVPPDTDISAALDAAFMAMLADPGPLGELAAVEQLDLRCAGFEEELVTVWFTLLFQLHMTTDIVERIGGSPFDNTAVWYSGTGADAELNAGIARFAMANRGRNYLARYYEPSGNLRVPVLTLHFSRDPIANLGHEERYAQVVAAAGNEEMLRQSTIDRFDHGGFTPEEVMGAFQELVTWTHEHP